MIKLSRAAQIQESLGPTFDVTTSTYEDGPPPRIRIARCEPRRILGLNFTRCKEVAWECTDGQGGGIRTFTREMAEELQRLLPNEEITVT